MNGAHTGAGRSEAHGFLTDARSPRVPMAHSNSSGSQFDSPVSVSSRNHTGYWDIQGGSANESYGRPVSREPSIRPPGALAPSAPGHTFGAPDERRGQPSPSFDIYSVDDPSYTLNGYPYSPPQPGPSNTLGVLAGVTPRPSREKLNTPSEQWLSSDYPASSEEQSPCQYYGHVGSQSI